ncbi:MAG TPA: FAD-binding oxidoreductase [Terriglobales bacterium]|nr:FAD-binding oxidoreductase [Terriglobales bacterium]
MEHPLITARLTQSEILSDRTKHLEFEVQGDPQFLFTPGQFISVREPRSDGKLITRAYSLASPPRRDNRFDLCLNRVDEGFMSNYLCDLEPGHEVHFHGPHGHFVLKPERRDAVFIATGTGIAPLRGMIHWLLADESRHHGHEFWLVYGTRYEKDIYYREEFEELAREHPNFHYVITLSRPEEGWQGAKGYVQEHVREIVGDRKDMEAYICGLNTMVSANRQQLKELGWDRHQIIYERYD